MDAYDVEIVRGAHGQDWEILAADSPGEILREDFMLALGLSMDKLALELRVPATRISEVDCSRASR